MKKKKEKDVVARGGDVFRTSKVKAPQVQVQQVQVH